jgi:hypothetical protein
LRLAIGSNAEQTPILKSSAVHTTAVFEEIIHKKIDVIIIKYFFYLVEVMAAVIPR